MWMPAPDCKLWDFHHTILRIFVHKEWYSVVRASIYRKFTTLNTLNTLESLLKLLRSEFEYLCIILIRSEIVGPGLSHGVKKITGLESRDTVPVRWIVIKYK